MISTRISTKPRALVSAIPALILAMGAATSYAVCGTMPGSTPDDQLVDNSDGTVTDQGSGLMWKKCSEGQTDDANCSGIANSYTWQAALNAPSTLNVGGGYAGHTDWRLPNLKEMRSLVEENCHAPSINETRFPSTPSASYWTSTSFANDDTSTWYVSMEFGYSNYVDRQNTYHIRLVRNVN